MNKTLTIKGVSVLFITRTDIIGFTFTYNGQQYGKHIYRTADTDPNHVMKLLIANARATVAQLKKTEAVA